MIGTENGGRSTIREPRSESNRATLSRIKKEMAQPRIAKSARKGA